MLKIFNEYSGLRKEVYALLFGRTIAAMGSLIFMMLTLILKNKLGYSSGQIASILLIMGLLTMPGVYLSGKLADRYNKRNLIIILSLIHALCILVCAVLPLSEITVVFYIAGALFSQMQIPCYEALFTDLSGTKDRERVFSLNYLGGNVGGVMSPIIGGFLFENHLNLAFLVTAVSSLIGTALITFYVKDVSKVVEQGSEGSYQKAVDEKVSVIQILRERKMLILYLVCFVGAGVLYSQLNFLLPLNYELLYGARGAFYFGSIMTFNASIVIVGMPLFTFWLRKVKDTTKMLVGQILLAVGLAAYIFIQGIIPAYFVVMFIFTLGEITNSLAQRPYLSKRMPASHRGRIIGLSIIAGQIIEPLFQKVMGYVLDNYAIVVCWYLVAIIGLLVVVSYAWLRHVDKKHYPDLYCTAE